MKRHLLALLLATTAAHAQSSSNKPPRVPQDRLHWGEAVWQSLWNDYTAQGEPTFRCNYRAGVCLRGFAGERSVYEVVRDEDRTNVIDRAICFRDGLCHYLGDDKWLDDCGTDYTSWIKGRTKVRPRRTC